MLGTQGSRLKASDLIPAHGSHDVHGNRGRTEGLGVWGLGFKGLGGLRV